MLKIAIVNMQSGVQKVTLEAPYHPNLPKKARELGGDFSHDNKCWYFDLRDEERVRKLAIQIYGTDGETSVELVTVHINMDLIQDMEQLWIFGRQVASRWDRDSRVRLGEGVIVIQGGFPNSAGSRRYPMLSAFEGTVLEIRDVPRELAEKKAKANPDEVVILETVNR